MSYALGIAGTLLLVYGVGLAISGQLRRPVGCVIGLHTWRWSRTIPHTQVCRFCPAVRAGHP